MVASIRDVRNQRDLTCTLDRRLQLSLMLGTGTGDPARQNLAALGHKGPQQLDVLVVDVVDLVRAELADFPPAEQRAPLTLCVVAGLFVAGSATPAAAATTRSSLSECH